MVIFVPASKIHYSDNVPCKAHEVKQDQWLHNGIMNNEQRSLTCVVLGDI